MSKIKQLQVLYDGKTVGTLAETRDHRFAFEYADSWIAEGFSISPFSLPLEKRVFLPKLQPFDGLFGVFADSLPDGWGRLLTDRILLKTGKDPNEVSMLERLALTGSSGKGALTYYPEYEISSRKDASDLDKIAKECERVLKDDHEANLDNLFAQGGSSGGARPKILTNIEGVPWIIKFFSANDPKDIGQQEYNYACCAKACGIDMEECRLFPSQICKGFFGTKRFDRRQTDSGIKRIHMVSASGLLETSHRIPNLDYNILMKLTLQLTGSMGECEKLYRLMCFNVFAHNRDDHSRNFSFLYLTEEARWILSPAYDLTYSNSIGGEHATMINGNGSAPGLSNLLAVADQIGISKTKARRIADSVKDIVNEQLVAYL